MKNIKSLSDQDLLNETRALAAEERRIGLELLMRLREIEARRLYAAQYSSLHEFVVHELKYSDGSAHRRIQAMRLLRELPEVEVQLRNGEMTLTNAGQLQDFFRAERKLGKIYAPTQKQELAKEVIGKSTRQVQALLMARSPEAIPRESLRPINGSEARLTLVVSASLQEKFERLKGLLAHRVPNATYAELLEVAADLAIQKLDPGKANPKRAKAGAPAPAEKAGYLPAAAEVDAPASKLPPNAVMSTPAPELPTAGSSSVPAALRRLVWRRAGSVCEQRLAGGKRCGSVHALQIDHIVPRAKDGPHTADNLQLLCRAHNQAKNRVDFGFVYVSGSVEGFGKRRTQKQRINQ